MPTVRSIRVSHTRFALLAALMICLSLPAMVRATDPGASVAAISNITTAGATSFAFEVRYTDDGGVVDGTIDNNDVRVTGTGYDVPATFVSLRTISEFTTLATYSIVPPGGRWDSADNGTYSIVMQPKPGLRLSR